MRSSLLLLISSILSNTILVAHTYVYVALRPFATAVDAIKSRRSSLHQPWNFNLAAKDSDSSALEEENQNVNHVNDAANPAMVSWNWEEVALSVFANDDRPVIMFDGQCNLCNGGVNFALDHDPKGM
jgi:hypothetical protein